MEGEHILMVLLSIMIIAFLWLLISGCKKKKPIDKFDKIPFVFYMHGKRFTPEEASEYYDIQKDRKIDPYLMIYDTELNEYVFKGNYSYYEKDYVTLKDSIYHE